MTGMLNESHRDHGEVILAAVLVELFRALKCVML